MRGGRPARSSRQWGRAQWMLGVQQWIAHVAAPPLVAVWLTWDAACRQHRWPVCNSRQGTAEPCHADICAWWHRVRTLLDLPHRASVSHHVRFESDHGRTDDPFIVRSKPWHNRLEARCRTAGEVINSVGLASRRSIYQLFNRVNRISQFTANIRLH